MSNTPTNALQTAAKNIDEICEPLMGIFANPQGFAEELSVATAVQKMRDMLTADVMKEVMALMNSSIGFDTDRNPKKAKAGEVIEPYSVEVIKDVFIESRLRGFHVIGKEFTVISGNFYAGVNGLDRLVRTHKKVANFRDTYDVPRSIGDKGALVKCKSEWLQADEQGGKQPQSLEREFAVRVNIGQGADAIIGKAKRKLLAAVLSRLTGTIVPEGDADDAPLAAAKPEAVAAPASTLFKSANPSSAPAAPADNVPMEGATPLAAKVEDKRLKTPQEEFSAVLSEAGVIFDDFRSFIMAKNIAKQADSWASFDEVPNTVIDFFKANPKAQTELIKKFGKQASK